MRAHTSAHASIGEADVLLDLALEDLAEVGGIALGGARSGGLLELAAQLLRLGDGEVGFLLFLSDALHDDVQLRAEEEREEVGRR